MANTYEIGDLVTLTARFRDRNKVLADPGIVTLRVRKPNGTIQVFVFPGIPVVKDSTGVYHADIDTTGGPAGVWTYQWEGTGAAQSVDSREFFVRESVFS